MRWLNHLHHCSEGMSQATHGKKTLGPLLPIWNEKLSAWTMPLVTKWAKCGKKSTLKIFDCVIMEINPTILMYQYDKISSENTHNLVFFSSLLEFTWTINHFSACLQPWKMTFSHLLQEKQFMLRPHGAVYIAEGYPCQNTTNSPQCPHTGYNPQVTQAQCLECFISQIVLYFLHNISVLSFHIDVVFFRLIIKKI